MEPFGHLIVGLSLVTCNVVWWTGGFAAASAAAGVLCGLHVLASGCSRVLSWYPS